MKKGRVILSADSYADVLRAGPRFLDLRLSQAAGIEGVGSLFTWLQLSSLHNV